MSEESPRQYEQSPLSWKPSSAAHVASLGGKVHINSLSVFFPDYNDGGTIASMALTALKVCEQVADDYEVIVVNDASTDYSQEVLDDLAANHPRFRYIRHETNRGYGGALRSGFAAATKEWVFYTDGDAQYDPHELVKLIAALRPGVDMVNGYKIARSDPIFRIIIGRLYHYGVKLMFGLRLRDTDCDFRLIRKDALEHIKLTSNTGTITVELQRRLQDAGYKFAEVPVHHYHRAYGESQFFNFPRIFRTLAGLLKLWWQLVVKGESRRARRQRITPPPSGEVGRG